MRVLIRADGDSAIGAGHVMRMMALAEQVLECGGEVTLASARLGDSLERRARSLGLSVARERVDPGSEEDVRSVVARATERGIDWVLADGYTLGDRFQEGMAKAGIRLLLLDDYGHCTRYCADLVLNQNLTASDGLYRARSERTKLLLGPAYLLVRREFLAVRGDDAPTPERATRILVTLGGADPVNATEKVIAALERLSDPALRAKVVVGLANSRGEGLRRRVRDPRIELIAGPETMAELMAWADLAIAGAGVTTYELCFMGVPAMLVTLAENQREVARAMAREGVCMDLGWHHELDSDELAERIREACWARDERREMIERGRTLVDGRGRERVLEAMCAHGRDAGIAE